ncbi:phage terminase small subunit-related protein [Brevibacillus agri]|uniref:phage terminase small subunit-related protein n=1 Tax=Brevibacillus agri TaxID=51101 RepID=UPI0025B658F4|nr:phage terminase small subunit-related protein [Brevibacillus agri]MDN4094358.1 phage terminase small subunit-related protein [Brevibacillus agri]
MARAKNGKRQRALDMYLHMPERSTRLVAEELSISEATVWKWSKEDEWVRQAKEFDIVVREQKAVELLPTIVEAELEELKRLYEARTRVNVSNLPTTNWYEYEKMSNIILKELKEIKELLMIRGNPTEVEITGEQTHVIEVMIEEDEGVDENE